MSNILKDNYEEHFALIIGIDEYENLGNLEYAVNDAMAIKDVLINKFGYKEENIKLLINGDATHDNIMDKYYELVNDTATNDSVIVFFAGHGSTYPSLQGNKGYLIPCDGTETKMNSLISWNDFIGGSDIIKAKHIFYIMDACYSGLALLRGQPSKRFLKDMIRRQARQVLTAGKSDQRVKDSGGKPNHSIFTGYLLEALNGAAKTDQGVLCASSVMNYVYNKVSNDPNSRQTPGFGTLVGEGDFIFNYDEIFDNEGDNSKDNDFLVEINNENRDSNITEDEKTIEEVKELLSDNKNFIKITEIVNNQLKIYLAKVEKHKKDYNVNTDEDFAKTVEEYKKDVEVLLKIVLLLAYYNGDLYLNLILKVLSRIAPNESSQYLFNYPVYLMYYVIIITGLEARNYKVLKSILEFKKRKTIGISYLDENRCLLSEVCDNMNNLSQDFQCFFPEKNYIYPLSEYIYKEIQPILDDFLYVGDEYPELFISAEILISVFYALQDYNEESNRVWGPLGRYTYQVIYGSRDLKKFPINTVIEEMNLYQDISNKDDFIKKYNAFLSKHYF